MIYNHDNSYNFEANDLTGYFSPRADSRNSSLSEILTITLLLLCLTSWLWVA